MEWFMLEGYFANVPKNQEESIVLNQRLLAVQAALEIAKASASSSVGALHNDLNHASGYVEKLADAIQSALKTDIHK